MSRPPWVYRFDDVRDRWLGDDKFAHYFGAAALFAHGWVYGGVTQGVLEVILGSLLINVVELVRYHWWRAQGYPEPWPVLCDALSLKDLTAELLGVLTMWGVLALGPFPGNP